MQTLRKAAPAPIPARVAIGHDILGLISSAMYVEPLTLYRELVQNAADAIDASIANGTNTRATGRIDITCDPLLRTIVVSDNGIGINNTEFVDRMSAVGASKKRSTSARGFRGIGRLVGLGYAQSLTFTSRSNSTEDVFSATWDCRRLRDLLRDRSYNSLNAAIEQVVLITKRRPNDSDPAHFFKVELTQLSRLGDDVLLNGEAVASYLSETAPLPFSDVFSHSKEIESALGSYFENPTFSIYLNGSQKRLTRPYRNSIKVTANKSSSIRGVRFLTVPAHDGDMPAAVAWIADHDYLGAIPTAVGVRGLRARIGNLQIGDDRVFSAVFPEERFSDWAIGEVHILDERIVPNGRRDSFEPNLHFANLLNHLSSLGREVAKRARLSSVQRRTDRELDELRETLKDIRSLLKTSPEAQLLCEELAADFQSILARAKRRVSASELKDGWTAEILKTEREIQSLKMATNVKRRPGKLEQGRVDVIRLIRSQVPGGISLTVELLKLLSKDDLKN